MRQIFGTTSSPNSAVARTTVLLILPYLSGILPMTSARSDPSFDKFPVFTLAFSVVTISLDIILFVYYIRYRRRLNEMDIDTQLTLSFGIRLFILCLIRFLLTGLPLVEVILSFRSGNNYKEGTLAKLNDAELLVEHLFPLFSALFFCQQDTLKLWFRFLKGVRVDRRA